MKKLILLLSLGITCVSVNAQQSNSVVFTQQANQKGYAHPMPARAHEYRHHANNTAAKTTGTYSDWFDMWDQNAISGTAAGYYNETYTDSNLYNPADLGGGGTGYIFCHGIGMSFDPTDAYYYALAVNGITDPPIVQTSTGSTPYAIDSFLIVCKYIRNNPSPTVTDSLIIDLIATSPTPGGYDSGVSLLQYNAAPYFVNKTTDSTPRFASAMYTGVDFVASPQPLVGEAWDSITVMQKQRYALPLTAAVLADTNAGGDLVLAMPLTQGNLQVAGGQKVVSLMSFKSGVHYAFGTDVSVANYMWLYSGDPLGTGQFVPQTPHDDATGYFGSYQDGLIAQNQIAYDGHGANSFTFDGHPILIPASAFMSASQTTPIGLEVPEQAFHVVWGDLGVKNVNNMVTTVNAFPNPATSQLTIAFTLSQAATASVSLTNVLGQVVATQNVTSNGSGAVKFNTSALSEGVYVYTVLANGQRTTGHVVIAH